MISSQSADNARNGALVYAKDSANGSGAVAFFGHESNFGNVTVAKFAVGRRHDARPYGMRMVSESRNPFEVFGSIVRLDRVDVIDLWEVVRVWNESHSDKAVNWDVAEEGRVPKINACVSTLPNAQTHVPAFVWSDTASASSAASNSVQASHSTEIADLVEMREPLNGDGAPFLNHPANFRAEMLASPNMALTASQQEA